VVGIRIPGYELRDLVEAADRENDEKIDLEEFKDVRTNINLVVTSASLAAIQFYFRSTYLLTKLL